MRKPLFCLSSFVACTTRVQAQITVRSGSGSSPTAVTPVRDQFRIDLGGGTVSSPNGSFGGLRREINWDGVPAASAAPNNFPANFFNVNSPRGVVVSTAGSGFQVSGAARENAPGNFGNLNASYGSGFQSFTAQRLFTPLGSNVFDVSFFVPGTTVPAVVNGFRLMLTDVDLAGTTSVRFFDVNGGSLGVFSAPPLNSGLSFLGGFASDNQARIARVRVTLGNTPIGPNDKQRQFGHRRCGRFHLRGAICGLDVCQWLRMKSALRHARIGGFGCLDRFGICSTAGEPQCAPIGLLARHRSD